MTLRWILCLLASLALHVVCIQYAHLTPTPGPTPVVAPMAVAQAEPVLPPPARPAPASEPAVPPAEPDEPREELEPEKFRPNTEAEEPEPPAEEPEEPLTADSETMDDSALASEEAENPDAETAAATVAERKEQVARYRRQLLEEFDEQWQEVPELNTVITDVTSLPRIDSHFGIAVLAYSFVDQKPAPPFILFDPLSGTFEKVETFDFSGYSNRIKDRMLYRQYRDQLARARRQYELSSLMKVIGLVPTSTDRYFSAKQLRAVQLAGLPLEQAVATRAHYEPDGSGGFHLIVDSVKTRDGRTLSIQDEERKFSAVAKQ